MMLLKLALLNMLRHARRTILILAAVAISVTVMETVSGLMEGMRANFFKTLTREGAHVTLYAKGWKERLDQFSLSYTIGDPDSIIRTIEEDDKVLGAEKVMNFGALLINEDKNIPMAGIGIEEASRYFGGIKKNIQEGTFPPGKQGIVISHKVADVLDLSLGDGLIVFVQDSHESPNYIELKVTGIFKSSSADFDSAHFFIDLSVAQRILFLPSAATEIRVHLKDPDQAESFVAARKDFFENRNLEATTWKEANGSILGFLNLFDFFMAVINVFIIIVSSTVITNAILMNMFERMREFGTLRAIGLKRRSMRGMIITEGVFQGAAGGILGLIIGIPIVLFFRKHGIDWGQMSDLMGVGNIIYFKFSPLHSFLNLVSGLVIAVVSSLYAAYVGGKLSITDSLTYI